MIEIGYCDSQLSWGPSWDSSEAEIRATLETVKDLGGSRIRISIKTGTIAETDLAVRLCVEFGVKPLLCLETNKAFGFANTPESFGAMCRNVATRYGPLGTGVFQNAATEYQILNEANSKVTGFIKGDVDLYVKYLKAGSAAIRSVHTSATVVACGTTNPSSNVVKSVDWYRKLISLGGAELCDAFAVHFYNTEANLVDQTKTRAWQAILGVRALMVANGIGSKKIWITEIGSPYPWSGFKDLVFTRDRLKSMMELVLAQDFVGPTYLYAVRDYSGGDGFGGRFGMVTEDFEPKEPPYSYAKSLAGGTVDPGDLTPPSDPVGLGYSEVGETTLKMTWPRNPDVDGVTNYRIFSFGVQVGDTTEAFFYPQGLTPGTEQSLYIVAVDAAGNVSGPSNVITPTTMAPTGSSSTTAGTFSGSTTPPSFSQQGLGVYVSSGVAYPNAPTTDGEYLTPWPKVEPQRSPDHWFRVSLAGASGGPDRAAGAAVRSSADGSQAVIALAPGGGNTDSLIIQVVQSGTAITVAGTNATPGTAADDVLISAEGNVYTARLIGPGEVILAEVPWTDVNGIYTGATNLGVGIVFWHRRVGGVYYPPSGVTKWGTSDLNAAQPRGGELWPLGLIDESDWPQFFATGSWESLT